MADNRKSYGKKTSVKCRVCKKIRLLQNYKDHIKSQHENEDCNDLRSSSQTSLQSVFQKPLAQRVKKTKIGGD